MTQSEDVESRRHKEAERIRRALNRQRDQQRSELKGGETAVAFVEERLCIG